MRARRARLEDAAAIHRLITAYSGDGTLLPRSLSEICAFIRYFFVVEHHRQVVGCGALHPYGPDLAEIRSIAVSSSAQRRGVGRSLVQALLREASKRTVGRVFLFTRIPDYFARLGFVPVDPGSLPEKIWNDCLQCPRFACCDETAMVFPGELVARRFARPATSGPAKRRECTLPA